MGIRISITLLHTWMYRSESYMKPSRRSTYPGECVLHNFGQVRHLDLQTRVQMPIKKGCAREGNGFRRFASDTFCIDQPRKEEESKENPSAAEKMQAGVQAIEKLMRERSIHRDIRG
ncbi:hypothetical protein ACLKMY_24865 [Paraburkholderia mimosarum]|uniref:hypothetical protein n=1 Tax=Paraburkholderia mimosarum TaxID=312026 RepID=UPI0039C28F26